MTEPAETTAPPTEAEAHEAAVQALADIANDGAIDAEPEATDEPESDDAGDDDAEPDDADKGDADAADEGDDDKQDDEPKDDDAKPTKRQKPSYLREAQRRQRAAARAMAKAEQLERDIRSRQEALERREREHQQFEDAFRSDPFGTMARKLGVTPEQLLALQGDSQAELIPPHIQAQLDAQRKELEEYKRTVAEEREAAAKAAREQKYQQAVTQDVEHLAGVTDRPDDAQRYPYFASLPVVERQRRARELVIYTVEQMDDPQQYGPQDLLEALDRQAKELHSGLTQSQWLAASAAGATKDDEPEPPPAKRRRSPSAKRAAQPAAGKKLLTEAELRQAAIAKLDAMVQDDVD